MKRIALLIAVAALSGCTAGKWTVDSTCTAVQRVADIGAAVCALSRDPNSAACVTAKKYAVEAAEACGKLQS